MGYRHENDRAARVADETAARRLEPLSVLRERRQREEATADWERMERAYYRWVEEYRDWVEGK